jgi:hypothetical protein
MKQDLEPARAAFKVVARFFLLESGLSEPEAHRNLSMISYFSYLIESLTLGNCSDMSETPKCRKKEYQVNLL